MNKILYITSLNPYEINSGGHQRTHLLCRALSQVATVDIACFTINNECPKDVPITNSTIKLFMNISDFGEKKNIIHRFFQIFRFYSTDFIKEKNEKAEKALQKILEDYDYSYVVVRYLPTALLCGLEFNKKVILDLDDLPEQLFKSLKSMPSNSVIEKYFRIIYYSIMSCLARLHTQRIIKNIYHAFLPNKSQCIYDNSTWLPNIPFPQDHKSKSIESQNVNNNSILFVGKMSYKPNFIGIDYFIKNIWPLVLEKIPSAHFNIVGIGTPIEKINEWNKFSNINIKGFVKNIEDEYFKTDAVICPIYHGAGTNIKILEAMLYNKPCVISEFSSIGFDDILKHEENILIALNDYDFAENIIKILTNKTLSKKISRNASLEIRNKYSFDFFSQQVLNIIYSNNV